MARRDLGGTITTIITIGDGSESREAGAAGAPLRPRRALDPAARPAVAVGRSYSAHIR
jgi:hypothetical protein